FGAFMTVWLLYPHSSVVIWLPWLWWLTARLVAAPTTRLTAALAGVVALSLLAGQPEMAYFLALATGLFLLFQLALRRPFAWRGVALRLLLWVAAYGLGALIAAVQLLPFLESLAQSAIVAHRAGSADPSR